VEQTINAAPHNELNRRDARQRAVAILSGSQSFKAMNARDQRDIYSDLVSELLAKAQGLAQPFATDSGKEMGYKGYDPAFQGDTQAFKELVDSVDFPKFVADLLKAVFRRQSEGHEAADGHLHQAYEGGNEVVRGLHQEDQGR
jgi:hypothetical protein